MPTQSQNSSHWLDVKVEQPTAVEESFIRKLLTKINAGNSFFWLYLPGDESRVENILRETAEKAQRWFQTQEPFKTVFWDPKFGSSFSPNDAEYPSEFLLKCASREVEGNFLVQVRDMHLMINANAGVTLRRTIAQLAKANALNLMTDKKDDYPGHIRPVFILADSPKPHPDIREYVTLLEIDLPNAAQMRSSAVDLALDDARQTALSCNKQSDVDAIDKLTTEFIDQTSESLLGLTSAEGYKMVCEAIASVGLTPQILEHISESKANTLAKTDGLKYVPYRDIRDPDTIGGYDGLMQYLQECKYSYTSHARSLHIERPRGMAIIGPPGTGKTTVASIAAKVLGLDLLILNINELFEGVVGGTEQKVSRLINTLKPMKKFALVIDEVDKLFASAHETQRNDGGVNARMFKSLLEFMSDRSAHDAFITMTLNRAEGIGPELFRSGRIDRIWYTPLPEENERLKIMELHLRMRSQDPSNWKLNSLLPDTKGFSGAELENLVTSAMRTAYASFCATNGRTPSEEEARPNMDQWHEAIKQITPSSQFDSQNVEKLEKFRKECGAVPVGAAKTVGKQSRRVGVANPGLN